MLNPVEVSIKEEDVVYVPSKEEDVKISFSIISNSMLVGAQNGLRHHGNGYLLCGVNGQRKRHFRFLRGWIDHSKDFLCHF